MFILVDAGYKRGVSSHSFEARSWSGKLIKNKSYVSNEESSIKSEVMSIVFAINWLNSLNKKFDSRIRIYTDCLPVYEAIYGIGNHNIDVDYIKHQLKYLNAKVIWRKRRMVRKADKVAKANIKTARNNYFINKNKVKYKCEGIDKFKPKRKNTYKRKVK